MRNNGLMEGESQKLYEALLAYVDRFVSKPGRMRRLEDTHACHLFVWTTSGLNRKVQCFEEVASWWEKLWGGKRVFCYDEWEGLRLAVTQVYRRAKPRLLVLTAFKKGAPVRWPPQKG
jgi:hypothetical protein